MSPGPHTVTPPPCPCQTCSPGPEEVSSPASAMGIDTGPLAHGSSGHLPLMAGKATMAAASGHSMGRGPQGVHGRRWGLGAIMVHRASAALSLQTKELCLCLNTATREHPVPAVHGDARATQLAPQLPAQLHCHPLGIHRTFCTS